MSWQRPEGESTTLEVMLNYEAVGDYEKAALAALTLSELLACRVGSEAAMVHAAHAQVYATLAVARPFHVPMPNPPTAPTAEDRELWRVKIAQAKASKTPEEFSEWLNRQMNQAGQ